MREILFRGKQFDGIWFEGFLVKTNDSVFIVFDNCYDEDLEYNFEGNIVSVIPETVSQYTGLKDKNGVRIFEGDICTDGKCTVKIICKKYGWYCEVIKGCILSVGLEFPLWQWDNCDENWNRQLEVIGNIYDNPELLKK